jgi:zinc transport system substrate-binding protein
MKYFILLLSFISSFVAAQDLHTIYTVNYPLAYFAERIAGKHAEVIFPAPKNVDPAYWKPEIKTILEFQDADLILLNGADYARWVQYVSLPKWRMVNTSASFRQDYIIMDDDPAHSHGPEGDYANRNTAFTTWLDFQQAIAQVKEIEQALIKADPKHAANFSSNSQVLESELLELDKRMHSLASNMGNQPVIFSHPVYQYLARAYHINGRSLHWEPQNLLDDDKLIELNVILKEHPATLFIWENEPLPSSVLKLESLGIKSVVFNPSGNRPMKGDFLGTMKQYLENMMNVINGLERG